MKQSLMTNIIQMQDHAVSGTYNAPKTVNMYPCGSFIIGVHIVADGDVNIVLRQDGKQLFPVRSNATNGQSLGVLGATSPEYKIQDLWIPVNPNNLMTFEYFGTGHLSIVVTMASEDNRSIEMEMMKAELNQIKEILKNDKR